MRLLDYLERENYGRFGSYAGLQGGCFRDCFCVDITNVVDWIGFDRFPSSDEEDDEKRIPRLPWDNLRQACPLAKLPFDPFWAEYRRPDGRVQGVLLTEAGDCSLAGEAWFWSGKEGFIAGREVDFRATTGSDWSLETISATTLDGPLQEMTFQRGRFLGEKRRGDSCFHHAVLPAFVALAFFHCKNVGIVKVRRQSERAARRRERRGIPRLVDFHFIEVHRGNKRGESSDWDEAAKGPYRPHIVRGHFKRRKTGLFFWKMHSRGGADPAAKGRYRVWPPTGSHKRDCIVRAR